MPLPVDHVDLASAVHDRSGGSGSDSSRSLEPVLGLLDPVPLSQVTFIHPQTLHARTEMLKNVISDT